MRWEFTETMPDGPARMHAVEVTAYNELKLCRYLQTQIDRHLCHTNNIDEVLNDYRHDPRYRDWLNERIEQSLPQHEQALMSMSTTRPIMTTAGTREWVTEMPTYEFIPPQPVPRQPEPRGCAAYDFAGIDMAHFTDAGTWATTATTVQPTTITDMDGNVVWAPYEYYARGTPNNQEESVRHTQRLEEEMNQMRDRERNQWIQCPKCHENSSIPYEKWAHEITQIDRRCNRCKVVVIPARTHAPKFLFGWKDYDKKKKEKK